MVQSRLQTIFTADDRLTRVIRSAQRGVRNLAVGMRGVNREGERIVRTNPFGRMTDKIRALGTRLGGLRNRLSGVNSALAGLGVVISGAAIGRMITDSTRAADAVGKLSQRTGLAVETIQEMVGVGELFGIEGRQMQDTLQRMTRRVGQSITKFRELGTMDETSKALDNIGIGFEQIQEASPDERLELIINALGTIEDEGERTAAAFAIFGDQGIKFTELVAGGMDGLKESIDTVRRTGGILTEEQTQQAADFNDSMFELKLSIKSIRDVFVIDFVPALQKGLDGVSNFIQANRELSGTFFKVGAATAVFGVLAIGIAAVVSVIGGFGIAIVAAATAAVAGATLIITEWNTVAEFFETTWERIKVGADQAWREITGGINDFIDGILDVPNKIRSFFERTFAGITSVVPDFILGFFGEGASPAAVTPGGGLATQPQFIESPGSPPVEVRSVNDINVNVIGADAQVTATTRQSPNTSTNVNTGRRRQGTIQPPIR